MSGVAREPDPFSVSRDPRRSHFLAAFGAVFAICAVLAAAWLAVSTGGLGVTGPLQSFPTYLPVYCYFLLLIPAFRESSRGRKAIAVSAVVFAVVFLTADLTALRFFGTPFVNIYSYIPVSAGNTSPRVVLTTLSSYVPLTVWLIAAGAVAGALLIANLQPRRDKARLAALACVPLAYAMGSVSSTAAAEGDPVIAELMATSEFPVAKLVHHADQAAFPLPKPTRPLPATVVLVILESAGSDIRSSDGRSSLSQRVIRDSGVSGWVDFPLAVTNSNASDISIPTLMTGSGAHEPAGKYASMPIVSQLAAERGYRTELITGSTMQFAGLDSILADGRFDRIVTGDQIDRPFVNDLAVDDYYAWRDAAETIGKSDGRLFMVLYFKALHAPFQNESVYGVPAAISVRRDRAAWIVERGFRDLFVALQKAGRLQDSLIVVAGDHGEFDNTGRHWLPRKRIETFDDGILSPIFFVKAPAGMNAESLAALRRNGDRLVANLDIAPTIADVLQVSPPRGLDYAGYSILRDVPEDRIVLSTSTNEWRAWPRTSLAVSQRKDRLTCNVEDLCKVSRKTDKGQSFIRKAGPGDPLFDIAASDPVLRRTLGQIYRSHF